MDLNSPFLFYQNKLRELALGELARGKDHDGIEARFGDILLLADRLLVSCATTPDHGDLPRRINNALSEIAENNAAGGIDLLRSCLEPWLKAIYERVHPALYSKQRTSGTRFNLFQVIRDLNLLSSTEVELTAEDASQISDPVRNAILLAKEHRNLPTHNAINANPHGQEVRIGLVSLLAALDRNRDAVLICLSGLIVRAFPDTHIDLLHRIRSERAHRLNHFIGRISILEDLRKLLENSRQQGGYIVVTAPEGFGKSAIAAKITDYETNNASLLGGAALQVARDAPWLPGALLHMGKQSKDPAEFISALIDQANTVLLRQIDPIQSSETTRAHTDPTEMTHDHNQQENVGSAQRNTQSLGSRMKPKLHEILDRLVSERGSALLIIDGLDEIGRNAEDFDFLPELLPKGSAIFMTMRPEDKLLALVSHKLHAKRIALEGFSVDEINELTGANDHDWNQKLHHQSRGAPLYVTMVSQQIKDVGGNYKSVGLPASMKAIFQEQSSSWRTVGVDDTRDPLQAILALLTIFEPVRPLKIDYLQSFLKHRGIILSGPALRNTITPVASQIEGLESGYVKLAVKAFAEHVRTSLYTVPDICDLLSEISEWLAKDSELPNSVLFFYLNTWTDATFVKNKHQRSSAETLIKRLVDLERHDVVVFVFSRWWLENSEGDDVPDFLISGLKAAAASGSSEAMYALGVHAHFSYGIKNQPLLIEDAMDWFTQAANLEHTEAMTELGRIILTNRGARRPPEEGEAWLQRAQDLGNEHANVVLGEHYLDGKVLTRNSQLGERLLRNAAAKNPFAKYRLAKRLFVGRGLMRDPQEGESLLRSASLSAPEYKIELAERLIVGNGLLRNQGEGERLLREACDINDNAKLILAERLLDGMGLDQNKEEGERLLRQAAIRIVSAKTELACRLLDGKVLDCNHEEGERLLRQAADIHTFAKKELAQRLLDGQGLRRHSKEGENLFRRIALEDANAKLILADRLLDGDGLEQNVEEGERLLREAATDNNSVKLSLAERLLDGNVIKKNAEEGESLLREVAVEENYAKLKLAERLLDGEGLDKNIIEGEQLLRESGVDNIYCKFQLAERLLDGKGLGQNSEEGDRLIREAISAGPDFLGRLAARLLDGIGMDKNIEEGETLLREAAVTNLVAKRELAERLLDGRGCPKNPIDGLRLFREVASTNFDASLDLAIRLLTGDGVIPDTPLGKQLLQKSTSVRPKPEDLGRLGAHGAETYKKASEAIDPDEKVLLWRCSAYCFHFAFMAGEESAGNNLAYIIRRQEANEPEFPPMDVLLKTGLATKEPFPTVNQALLEISGIECQPDWRTADRRISSLTPALAAEILEWWHGLAQKNDPEGHLVVGWLARHSLIEDPDGWDIAERFSRAKSKWAVPDSICVKAPQT